MSKKNLKLPSYFYNNFIILPPWLLMIPHLYLSHAAKLVYGRMVICWHVNNGMNTTRQKLAEELGMRLSEIDQCLTELYEFKLISNPDEPFCEFKEHKCMDIYWDYMITGFSIRKDGTYFVLRDDLERELQDGSLVTVVDNRGGEYKERLKFTDDVFDVGEFEDLIFHQELTEISNHEEEVKKQFENLKFIEV